MSESWTGAILVGGESRRMGCDKAFVELDGRTFLARAIDAIESAGGEPLIVAHDGAEPFARFGRVVVDPPGPRCAMRGLGTALAAAVAPGPAIVLAVDYPRADAASLAVLRARLAAAPRAIAAVPREGDRLHPLFAAWRPEVAPLVEASLGRGELSLHRFLDAHERVLVDDLDRRLLINVNDEETRRAP